MSFSSYARRVRYSVWGVAFAAVALPPTVGVAATLTFTTSGTYVVPAGVHYVDVTVAAPGGGGGGCDAAGAGGNGGAGELASGRIPVTPGQSYTITVGTAGGGGASAATCGGAGSAGGGTSSGGAGGAAGCAGSSGSGGGGGGGSGVLLGAMPLVVAGGGAGGTGGSLNANGIAGAAGGSAGTASGLGATGGAGVGSIVDGAGGGGGGAGTVGGAGGPSHADNTPVTLTASGGVGGTAAIVTSPVRTPGSGAAGGVGASGAGCSAARPGLAGASGSIVVREVFCASAADCDDGISCTVDTCASNSCSHTAAASGTTCPTGVCNGGSTAGSCVQCIASAQCSGTTPACNTTTDTCRACAVATQGTDCAVGTATSCNTATGGCVAPAVALTSPPAGVTTTTTNAMMPLTGTGVPGQSVNVTSNGVAVCTATVGAGGTWSCTPPAALPVGSDTLVATSNGASSTAVLVVQCTTSAQCGPGQACNTTTGACVTPACRGNAGSGSTSDCPSATPVCTSPGTSSASCGTCTAPLVYNTATFVCVTPSVVLTAPPAGGTASTTNLRFPITGTGVPGQVVNVFENGTFTCTVSIGASGSWTCTPTANLPIGSDMITATSGGATSGGTLVVQCTTDGECNAGQVCNAASGACVAPTCLGSYLSGSAADCTSATPVCVNPGTASAACTTCAAGQVYNTATFACVAPAVALTYPPAGTTASTPITTPTITGTGVPGETVTVTANGMTVCTAVVATNGLWSCMSSVLPVGSNNIVATSGTATSNGTLVVQCTSDGQCSSGQVCNMVSGACVSPMCRGNAGSGSLGDCPVATPVCSFPGTVMASCGACPAGLVYNSATFVCVAPTVTLLTPPSGGMSTTTNVRQTLTGTGVAGQSVAVTANGVAVCVATVASDSTWSCAPTSDLPIGSDAITATSAGAITTGTLVVQCTTNAQCSGGQVCNDASGVCVTPSCAGNAGSGSSADCPSTLPVCMGPHTVGATCVPCAAGQVYDTATFACVSPSVALTSPPAGSSSSTTNVRDPITGTGVPGTTVAVTANGSAVCNTVVAADGTWTCTPTSDLPVGSLAVTATSAGATSSGTLVVACTTTMQCTIGQVCDVTSGACTTPSCAGNAGSGSSADCPTATPVCTNPGTPSAMCIACAAGQVFDTTAHACTAPAVALTTPPAGGTGDTHAVRPTIAGTGVPGQTVTVSINGMAACTALVAPDGTWTCAPMSNVPIGSNTVTATSDGVTSTGTLIVQCTLDGQCGTGQLCNVASGVCSTPSCLGNAGSGSAADCTTATPVCTGAGTPGATCSACPTGQVYDTATFLCAPGTVTLTSPPAGGSTTTTASMPVITGTGIPGQSVTVTDGTMTVCMALVHPDGTWTCTSTVALPLGSNVITATSAGATSMGTLVVHCAFDGQCLGATPVCNVTTGACVGCLIDSQCTAGTYCDTTMSTCRATLPTGQPCGRATECISQICTGGRCAAVMTLDGGVDGGTDGGHGSDAMGAEGFNITGDGACSCRAAGSTRGGGGGFTLSLAGVAIVVMRRRARGRRNAKG